ncbi:stabilizer of axonemal microtubules 1 [Chrysoperla carnea]|uniref:stabilizer of axonemal microtubules 1 n=1 Tax=Chrysoperla carnea TaxID=189513 RepID=UPI001D09052C|nr:stabilizer of axonemal microtubules 1 [Chrysoperla carnea]
MGTVVQPLPMTEFKKPIEEIITAEQAACIDWPPGGTNRPCQCRRFLQGQNILVCPSLKKYCPPARPKQFRPTNELSLSKEPFDHTTIYRGSYIPSVGLRAARRILKGELCLSGAPFDGRTINRMSYPGWHDVKRAEPIRPCRAPLWSGPQHTITTHKHDYVPKPICKRVPLVPNAGNLCVGDGPFEKFTTSRASYQPFPFQKSIRILHPNNFCTPKCPMEKVTTHKLSYQPNPVGMRARRPPVEYKPPMEKVDTNTIYRMSYVPPGVVCENECAHWICDEGKGCYCDYPGQCFGLPDPRKVLYPKAQC